MYRNFVWINLFRFPLSSYNPHSAFDFSFFLCTPGFLLLLLSFCVTSKKNRKTKFFLPTRNSPLTLAIVGEVPPQTHFFWWWVGHTCTHYSVTPFFTAVLRCLPSTTLGFRTLHTPPSYSFHSASLPRARFDVVAAVLWLTELAMRSSSPQSVSENPPNEH